MSVIIENFEMPEACAYCPLTYDDCYCRMNNKIDLWAMKDWKEKRHDDCPLVDITDAPQLHDVAMEQLGKMLVKYSRCLLTASAMITGEAYGESLNVLHAVAKAEGRVKTGKVAEYIFSNIDEIEKRIRKDK